MTAPDLTPIRHARRRRILQAAERVFREEGYRGASMERIAEAAGMSKVTLYSYFPDKETVFENVARAFAEDLRTAFAVALSGDKDVGTRMAEALVGKQLAVFDTVRGSSRPQELFAARDEIAASIFDALDQELIVMLTTALRGTNCPEPERIARVLFAASQGIANHARHARDAASDIRFIVAMLLAT